jgi:hypothetical protein
MRKYSAHAISSAISQFDVLPTQIVNLGMFDYVGYDFALRNKLRIEDILRTIAPRQSSKSHKINKAAHHIDKLPADMRIITEFELDWGCFRSRFARIEGFMRTLLF